jgi:predicted glycosyltransferase
MRRVALINVWVDLDNPPQTRYMLPLARAFEEMGCKVLLTARDYGDTFAILRNDGVSFLPIGSRSGSGKLRKVGDVLRRSERLVRLVRLNGKPDLLVSGARSAALAARRLRIPTFVVVDYEYVDLLVFRIAGSHIVHPDVIDQHVFRSRGFQEHRLMSFAGLKEDFSFAGMDLGAIPPVEFDIADGSSVRVLFRPPAEESHYYRVESGRLGMELLHFLGSGGAQVIFSPRYDWQVRYLDRVRTWTHQPVVLQRPAQFVSLLKGVDIVVSGGGTMLREAAFLGIPAYSIFHGRIGAVDQYLTSIKRLSILSSPDDFSTIRLRRRPSLAPLRQDRAALDRVVDMILGRAGSK